MRTSVQQDRLVKIRQAANERLDRLANALPQSGGDLAAYLREAMPYANADPEFKEKLGDALRQHSQRRRDWGGILETTE